MTTWVLVLRGHIPLRILLHEKGYKRNYITTQLAFDQGIAKTVTVFNQGVYKKKTLWDKDFIFDLLKEAPQDVEAAERPHVYIPYPCKRYKSATSHIARRMYDFQHMSKTTQAKHFQKLHDDLQMFTEIEKIEIRCKLKELSMPEGIDV